MDVNSDFSDLLRALNDAGARYLLIGGYAVAFHAEPRFTKNIDLWTEATPENARRVWNALQRFGAPLAGVSAADFENPQTVYQLGIAPNRIDILAGIDGVSFASAWRGRVVGKYGDLQIWIIGRRELIQAKRATGRPQDLLDIRRLQKSSARSPKKRPGR